MSCRYFRTLWERTCLTAKEVKFFHGSQLGNPRGNNPVGTEGAEYPRLEFFLKREPLRGAPCKCGGEPAWKCCNRTRVGELMGEGRR